MWTDPLLVERRQIKKMTLNARIETATEKPTFRNSVENCCLIIPNAYYEWQWLDPKGKQKKFTPKNFFFEVIEFGQHGYTLIIKEIGIRSNSQISVVLTPH